MEGTVGTFSITKVTGVSPETVTTGGHDQPPTTGNVVVVATGSTERDRVDARPHLRVVRD
jgi:hypothetical protein